ncbi:Uncharacterised protein [Vibrio cholerae]|nr:Uncharacterised protein [Vibrio cholerae]
MVMNRAGHRGMSFGLRFFTISLISNPPSTWCSEENAIAVIKPTDMKISSAPNRG